MTIDNNNENLNAEDIMNKMLAERHGSTDDAKKQSGDIDDDFSQLGSGVAMAAKADEGSKNYSNSDNASSIWSRMKSSFYTSGYQTQSPKNQDQVEPGQKKRKLDPEATLAEILRETKEEEERWELTGKNIFDKEEEDKNLPSDLSDDDLVGGTIILPAAGGAPASDRNASPALSLRASMVDTSILAEEKAPKDPDDITILGSTTKSVVVDNNNNNNNADANADAKNMFKKEENDGEKNHAESKTKTPANTGNVTVGDENWGGSFEAIGKQMFLSDITNAQNKSEARKEAPFLALKSNKAKLLCIAVIVVSVCILSTFSSGRFSTVPEPPMNAPIEANSPDNIYQFAEEVPADIHDLDEELLADTATEPTEGDVLLDEDITEVNVSIFSTNVPAADASIKFPPVYYIGNFEDKSGAKSEAIEDADAVLRVLLSFDVASFSAYVSSPFVLMSVAALVLFRVLAKATKGNTSINDKNQASSAKGNKSCFKAVAEKKRASPGWMKYHSSSNIFSSTYKAEVVTRKGNIVEVKRSARSIKVGSTIKHE